MLQYKVIDRCYLRGLIWVCKSELPSPLDLVVLMLDMGDSLVGMLSSNETMVYCSEKGL